MKYDEKHKFNVGLSSKSYSEKPIGKDISSMTFFYEELTIEDFLFHLISGHSYCGVFKNEGILTIKQKRDSNYIGSQVIGIDVDHTSLKIDDFIGKLDHKPSFYYTTYNNSDENPRFRLIYVFDEMIEGKDHYKMVSKSIMDSIEKSVGEKVDDCSSKCSQYFNGTDINNDKLSVKFKNYNLVYNIDDFDVCPPSFKEEDPPKIYVEMSDTSSTRFELNDEFKKDLCSLRRKDFLDKYSGIYHYVTSTIISEDMSVKGYYDLRNIDYYEVESEKYYWNNETKKYFKYKVQKGYRKTRLFYDGLTFKMILVDRLTPEYLVYLMIKDVYDNFYNGDGKYGLKEILSKVYQVLNSNIIPRKTNRKFKIDKKYWYDLAMEKGDTVNWSKVRSIIMNDMKDNDFSSLYDPNKSIEYNIKNIECDKRTLMKWLKENDISYFTDKDLLIDYIKDILKINDKLSIKEITEICKDNGFKCSYMTIKRIIDKINDI